MVMLVLYDVLQIVLRVLSCVAIHIVVLAIMLLQVTPILQEGLGSIVNLTRGAFPIIVYVFVLDTLPILLSILVAFAVSDAYILFLCYYLTKNEEKK